MGISFSATADSQSYSISHAYSGSNSDVKYMQVVSDLAKQEARALYIAVNNQYSMDKWELADLVDNLSRYSSYTFDNYDKNEIEYCSYSYRNGYSVTLREIYSDCRSSSIGKKILKVMIADAVKDIVYYQCKSSDWDIANALRYELSDLY